MHTHKIMSYMHSCCLHRLPLKAHNNTSSKFVRIMCKSYDILKSHCEIVSQWKTALPLCTKPLISQPKDSEKLNASMSSIYNHPCPLISSGCINFLIGLTISILDPILLQISDCESQFQLVSTLKCHSEVSIWNYNQGLFQGQVWNILCSTSLITQTEDHSIINGTNDRPIFKNP